MLTETQIKKLLSDLKIRRIFLRLYYIGVTPKSPNAIRPFTDSGVFGVELYGEVDDVSDSVVDTLRDNYSTVFDYLTTNSPLQERVTPSIITSGDRESQLVSFGTTQPNFVSAFDRGSKGDPGATGTGITAVSVVGSDLVVTLTNSENINAGKVVGSTGAGITNPFIDTSGNLKVTTVSPDGTETETDLGTVKGDDGFGATLESFQYETTGTIVVRKGENPTTDQLVNTYTISDSSRDYLEGLSGITSDLKVMFSTGSTQDGFIVIDGVTIDSESGQMTFNNGIVVNQGITLQDGSYLFSADTFVYSIDGATGDLSVSNGLEADGKVLRINPAETVQVAGMIITGGITFTDATYQSTAAKPHYQNIGTIIDGEGVVITTGSKGHRHIEQDFTIQNAFLLGDVVGDLEIHITRDSNYGLNGSTIGIAALNSGMTSVGFSGGFTAELLENDIIEFVVVGSPVDVTKASLFMKVEGV